MIRPQRWKIWFDQIHHGGQILAIPIAAEVFALGAFHNTTMEFLEKDFPVGGTILVTRKPTIGAMIETTLKVTITKETGVKVELVWAQTLETLNNQLMTAALTLETALPNYGT